MTPSKAVARLLRLGAHRLRDDRAAFRRVGAIVGERSLPGFQERHDLSGLLADEFIAHDEDVGDQSRVFACGIEQLDLVALRLGEADIGFVGDCHRHPPGDQGRAGIGRGHRHLLNVVDAHAVGAERVVQQDVAGGALFVGNLLALEIGDRSDRAGRNYRIGGHGHIEQSHDLDRQPGRRECHRGVGGDVAALQLTGRQRRVDVGVGREIDDLDLFEAVGLEYPLLGRDVPDAVAEPGLDPHLDGAGLGLARNIARQGAADGGTRQQRCSAGLQNTPAVW